MYWPSCKRHGCQSGKERGDTSLFWMVGHDWKMRLIFENLDSEHAQSAFWTDFDKGPCAGLIHGLDLCGPLDGGGHLQC